MDVKNEYDRLIDDFIQTECNKECNPFLATRIMTIIEKEQSQGVMKLTPGLKTVFVGLSLVVTIFTGILAGNLFKPGNESAAIILMNDQQMEHFSFYNQIGDE
jgi:hypothetical protein